MNHVWKVLLLTCAGTSLAMAQNIQGEKWKITSSVQMGGMSMPGMSSEICKQPGDDSVPVKTDDNCSVYDINRVGNVQSFKMRCTGKDAMEGSGQFTYLGADRYQGKMQVTTQGETMNMSYEGQKLGKCDGAEINLQGKKMEAEAKRQMANAEKVQQEQCHNIAAEGTAPTMMTTLCKDPADVRTFCAAAQTHDKFRVMAEMERDSNGSTASLSEAAQLCAFSVDTKRVQLCGSAEQSDNFKFIVSQCPVQGQRLAAAQCAGRTYTSMNARYRDFCSSYASTSARNDADAAADATPAGKAKGLLNKSKKALGGIFSN